MGTRPQVDLSLYGAANFRVMALDGACLAACRLYGANCGHYVVFEEVEGVRLAHVLHTDDRLVKAHLSRLPDAVYHLLHRHFTVRAVRGHSGYVVERGLLDLLVRAAQIFAVSAQHVELVLYYILAHALEEIAGVG